MLLTIDIGNTNIKLGVYAGAELRSYWRVATERLKLADEYAALRFVTANRHADIARAVGVVDPLPIAVDPEVDDLVTRLADSVDHGATQFHPSMIERQRHLHATRSRSPAA